ncbi:MAG: histidinol-phosphate transaminase [Myxococcota bacterium]
MVTASMPFSFRTILPFGTPLRSDLAGLGAAAAVPAPIAPASRAADRLDANEYPYDLPEPLKRELSRRIAALASHRYPDDQHRALSRAIARYVEQSGGLARGAIDEGHLAVGSGSSELLRAAIVASCVGNDGVVMTFTPTFAMYDVWARTLGVPVLSIPRDPRTDAIDLAQADHLVRSGDQGRVRVVFVTHPNSPTGVPLTTPEIAWLRALPEDVLVVVDEAYFEFCGHTLVAEIFERPHFMITRTFSKGLRLAAFRVGYAVMSPRLCAAIERVRAPFNVSAASQLAAQIVLEHHESLRRRNADVLAERGRLGTALAELESLRVWPSAANYLFVTLRDPNADRLALLHQQLTHRGTLVRQTAGGLRITIGTREQNRRTEAHLRRALEATDATDATDRH